RPPPKGGWMATERLSMRQTRKILRQKWSLGRTHREVAQSLGISCGAVGTTVLRARAAGLDWAQVDTPLLAFGSVRAISFRKLSSMSEAVCFAFTNERSMSEILAGIGRVSLG